MAHTQKARWAARGMTLGALGMVMSLASTASAQTTPVEIGAGQNPYVLIIFDTSASMAWTDRGDNEYPTMDTTQVVDGASWPAASNHTPSFRPGDRLNLPGSAPRINTLTGDPFPAGTRVDAIGPCAVWHPMNSSLDDHRCENYTRPGACSTTEDNRCWESSYNGSMRNRLEQLGDNPNMRLSDSEKPRHVMVKEILAGDLYLEIEGASGTTQGPGCWFVPRGRGASLEEQVCAIDNSSVDNDARRGFRRFIDYDDPRPHIQEVWNVRYNNGLIETMSSTAIFAVTMFDGYRYDGVRSDGWQWPMQDIIAGTSPYVASGATEDDRTACAAADGPGCYDMGIYRVIGPTRFDLNLEMRRGVADFTQRAVLDAGFLQHQTSSSDIGSLRMTGDTAEGFPSEFDQYVDTYILGKQPMAMATPFGGVFHDLHQYFLHGQYQSFDAWDDDETDEVSNPHQDDPYKMCRPRHVVLFTDGYPEPEIGSPGEIGTETLNEAFGYVEALYRYQKTEEAISDMMVDLMEEFVPEDNQDRSIWPRVHILGVNVDANEEISDKVVAKMARMARAGETCAQFYLPPEMLPVGAPAGPRFNIDDTTPASGTCVPSADPADPICLLAQNKDGFPGYDYEYGMDGETFHCDHPALVFSSNSKSAIRQAFQRVFNEILNAAGVASRTRPSMTSYLDQEELQGQYRIFSGMSAGGDSPFWSGLMHRQTLACGVYEEEGAADGDPGIPGAAETVPLPIHEQINMLRFAAPEGEDDPVVETFETVSEDRRRVFTSLPQDLQVGTGAVWRTQSDLPGTDFGQYFVNRYEMVPTAAGADEFGGSDLANADRTRIPLEADNLESLYGTLTDWEEEDFFNALRLVGEGLGDRRARLEALIDEVRGRSASKGGRVLGAILHSNPVTVGPPDLDIPIDSYLDFRARYLDRPTMTYVSTLDGQLHAIYAGQPDVKIRNYGGADSSEKKSASLQREAWAYVPHMLQRRLAEFQGFQPQLLDGAPVVADVRLCHSNGAWNGNAQACGTAGVPDGVNQWRTVLVQGLGEVGRGYFALDVTRSEARTTEMPDPVVLWEFDDEWEDAQLQLFNEMGDRWRYGVSHSSSTYVSSVPSTCTTAIGIANDDISSYCRRRPRSKRCRRAAAALAASVQEIPMLARSAAEPAIGTAIVKYSDATDSPPLQRPIAAFPAGSASGVVADIEECTNHVMGKGFYVVDLQTGTILRRFVDYRVTETDYRAFPAPLTGSPVLYNDFPGSIVTRGFVGDSHGRLYRIDMTRPDPRHWYMELWFDPSDSSHCDSNFFPESACGSGVSFGPAHHRPAVAMNRERNIVVVYGLGERTETMTGGKLQAVFAIEEQYALGAGGATITPKPIWREVFDADEMLTGEPVVFDNGVYFTTYYTADACDAGYSRIWGLSFYPEEGTFEPVGIWGELEDLGEDNGLDASADGKWFGPIDPTLIRGVAVTMGAVCSVIVDDGAGSLHDNQDRKPQLVASTAGADLGGQGGRFGGSTFGGGKGITPLTRDLAPPRTTAVPLSWTVISN